MITGRQILNSLSNPLKIRSLCSTTMLLYNCFMEYLFKQIFAWIRTLKYLLSDDHQSSFHSFIYSSRQVIHFFSHHIFISSTHYSIICYYVILLLAFILCYSDVVLMHIFASLLFSCSFSALLFCISNLIFSNLDINFQ